MSELLTERDRREIYASPNGDRWYLARSPTSGRTVVEHVPNIPSGGRPSTIELATFLSRPGNPPEQQALIALISTLVTDSVEDAYL